MKKFRSDVTNFIKGYKNVDDIKSTLNSLRKIRRSYMKLLSNLKERGISTEYQTLTSTLIEFASLVSIREEIELLRELLNSLTKRQAKDDLIAVIKSDLKEAEKMDSLVLKVLSKL